MNVYDVLTERGFIEQVKPSRDPGYSGQPVRNVLHGL